MNEEPISCEILVIGSGPGGAITACFLAEAGKDVVLVENGPFLPLSSSKSYSTEEMDQKYRHGGLTVAFGKNKIAYAEAQCMGGGSEINSALYHRPLPRSIQTWCDRYQIEELQECHLEQYFQEIERDLSVSYAPGKLSSPSLKLQEGADKLNWKHTETARCFKYQKQKDGLWVGNRQSMSETYLPRALKAGCRIIPNTKVERIDYKKQRANRAIAVQVEKTGKKKEVIFHFQQLFICAGAVQTPFLLRKSGITCNIGNTLRMHPMVRIAAYFPDEINDDEGVPVVQIEEFKPNLTLGCSCSSPAHLVLWLDGPLQNRRKKLHQWKHMAIYYAATTPLGIGSIRSLPLIAEPLVSYKLLPQDMKSLGEGLYRLGQVLFASGAEELIFPIQGYESVKQLGDLDRLNISGLAYGSTPITAIHLFSSCPMGEDRSKCAVNSYGKVHGFDNIYLNDASILPDCPGVNPQATIMAIALRNVKKFLRVSKPNSAEPDFKTASKGL